MDCIQELYLGTHGGDFCAVRKWMKLTSAHVSNVILVIYDLIYETMCKVCLSSQVRRAPLKFFEEGFLGCYHRAIKHAEFLLRVECEGHLVTNNPDFERLLAKYRTERHKETTEFFKKTSRPGNEPQNTVFTRAPDFMDQVYGNAHNALKAYYEIARAGLMDGISQQVFNHFLLRGEQSVFQVFTPERVLSMTSEEVRSIAGESPDDVRLGEELVGKPQQVINKLEKALDILRT
ncbi:uncharacterized protein F4812DRAFT_461861 [Daldinia caldariorum]|uniref:uncharacterized protein n=1 Tax=Daldinia caldariorum TaxID=326644 RepID=UPI0020075990|nr:uncharacterized protein F4812DRAFT_461861 [Daldinia caldariorum]KAI1465546.1 hypothetical protein F4812DRAFT_461861 [Daldinia caldariorum]